MIKGNSWGASEQGISLCLACKLLAVETEVKRELQWKRGDPPHKSRCEKTEPHQLPQAEYLDDANARWRIYNVSDLHRRALTFKERVQLSLIYLFL
jgi:hypothetical protein